MRRTKIAILFLAVCMLATRTLAQDPFACTGEAFIIQNASAQLTQVDQATDPFEFNDIGGPAGVEINNLGFRSTDGFLYGVELTMGPNGNNGVVMIDNAGNVTSVAAPAGLPTNVRFAAGDVTPDGTTMYLNEAGTGTLYEVPLPGAATATGTAIGGAGTGVVFDWAVSPIDGLLYGGDQTGGQLAVLNPTTGVRTDSNVGGLGLPAGTAYGGAWFNAAGTLFLYRNNGEIYEIDVSGPTTVDIQTGGPSSTLNDGAACIQDVIGVGKHMTNGGAGLPDTITIDFTLENLSATDTLSNLSAEEDLVAVFGERGTGDCGNPTPLTADWIFGMITSNTMDFENTSYNGDPTGDIELINQAPTQALTAGSSATIQVTITLCNNSNAEPGGPPHLFCNSVLFTGENPSSVLFGDVSHDDGTTSPDPDPNMDGSPDERVPACVGFDSDPPPPMSGISLVKSLQSNADEDGSGDVSSGDTLTYGFAATNTGATVLTNVSISDPLPGLSALSCTPAQPTSLAPGATLSCAATYVVTAADVAAGQIVNTATASSDQAGAADSETVPLPTPAISLSKTGVLDLGPDGEATPGDLLDYLFEVMNSGTAGLTNISITDPKVSPITCPTGNPIPTLAPGASQTCTGSYAITETDINAGSVVNTATADSDQTGPVEDTHMETIPVRDTDSLPPEDLPGPGGAPGPEPVYATTSPGFETGTPQLLTVWQRTDGIHLRLTDPENPQPCPDPDPDPEVCPLIADGGTQPAVAYDAAGEGSFLVVWVQEGAANPDCPSGHVCGQVVDSSAAPRGEVLDISGMPLGNEYQRPVVAVDKSFNEMPGDPAPCETTSTEGDFLVVWQSTALQPGEFSGIEGRCVRAGIEVGDQFPITGMPLGNERWFTPRMARDTADPNDGILVVWQKESLDPVQNKIFEIGGHRIVHGMPLGNEVQISATNLQPKHRPDAAYDPTSDSFLVVWESDAGIRGHRVQEATTLGSEFQVHAGFLAPARPRVAGLDGQFVVAWQDVPDEAPGDSPDSEIYGRFVDASGHPAGTEFQVSDFDDDIDDLFPAVDATPDASRFAITWRRVQATDLEIALTATPDPATPGGNLTYTIDVSNTDSNPAPGVMVTGILPAGVSVVDPPPAECNVSDSSLSCDLGELEAGANSTVNLTVTIDADFAGFLTFEARVDAAVPDRDEGNNSAAVTTAVLGDPFATVVGDFDGDGDLDAAGTMFPDGPVTWWRNIGGGAFGGPSTLPGMLAGPISVAAGDVDGDGDLDLVGAAFFDGEIWWWQNDGDTPPDWFQYPVNDPSASPFANARSVALEDVDRDGDLDVVASSSTAGVRWWRNDTGDGLPWTEQTITAASATAVTLADVDQDGDADIVGASVGGEVLWWKNHDPDMDGNVDWNQCEITDNFIDATAVAVADLDGDSAPDVVAAHP